MLLKQILAELLLKEVTEDTVLYHRSFKNYKLGDIINPSSNEKSTDHYKSFSNEGMEMYLEKYRKENHPELPSRGKCVYCSVVPRSAFYGKGYLYEVKPRGGPVLVTLANLINQMGSVWAQAERSVDRYESPRFRNDFNTDEGYQEYTKKRNEEIWFYAENRLNELFKFYWSGTNYSGAFKKDAKWIEVLCHSAEVVGVGGEESFKFFKKGDIVKTKIDLEFEVYMNEKEIKNDPDFFEKLKKIYKDVKIPEKAYEPIQIVAPAGTKIKLENVVMNQSKFKSYKIGDDGIDNYLSVYRSIFGYSVDEPKIPLDLRRVLWKKNYGKKAQVKLEDLIEKA